MPLILIAAGLAPIAGVLIVATGWALKFTLVTRAAYQQGVALQRAHATIKPGWTEGSSAV